MRPASWTIPPIVSAPMGSCLGAIRNPPPAGHDDVLALPRYVKSSLFERSDSPEVGDSGYLWHELRRGFHFPQCSARRRVVSPLRCIRGSRPECSPKLPLPWRLATSTRGGQGTTRYTLLRSAIKQPNTSYLAPQLLVLSVRHCERFASSTDLLLQFRREPLKAEILRRLGDPGRIRIS